MRQFIALREPRSAKRMPLGQQTPRWVGDDPAAVAVVAVGNKARSLALAAQSQAFVRNQLNVRKWSGESLVLRS